VVDSVTVGAPGAHELKFDEEREQRETESSHAAVIVGGVPAPWDD